MDGVLGVYVAVTAVILDRAQRELQEGRESRHLALDGLHHYYDANDPGLANLVIRGAQGANRGPVRLGDESVGHVDIDAWGPVSSRLEAQ